MKPVFFSFTTITTAARGSFGCATSPIAGLHAPTPGGYLLACLALTAGTWAATNRGGMRGRCLHCLFLQPAAGDEGLLWRQRPFFLSFFFFSSPSFLLTKRKEIGCCTVPVVHAQFLCTRSVPLWSATVGAPLPSAGAALGAPWVLLPQQPGTPPP